MSETRKCVVCANRRRVEIDRDLRADPMASEWYAKLYKIPALALLDHARVCLASPLLAHAETLEEHALKLSEIGLRILNSNTGEPAQLTAARGYLSTAADLREKALNARGLNFTHIDLQRSPVFRAFLAGLVATLSEKRFKIDDHAALKCVQAMLRTAEGDPGAGGGGEGSP